MGRLRMHLRNLDLIAAMCFVVATIGWSLLPSRPLIVGIVLALPLVFMIPGYMLTQLFPVGRGKPFGAVELIVFSLGLSLVIDILTGFLLNLLPIGLQWQSWTLSLGLVAEVFTLLAVLKRRRQGQGQPAKQKDAVGRHLHLKQVALIGAALAIAATALWLSIIRPPQPHPIFTQFWMLPATSGKSCAVLIGVRSFEAGPESYSVVVTSNGKQVASWSSITLATQQEWDHQLTVLQIGASNAAMVDARLYRLDQPGMVYREVHVMLRGCGHQL